MKKLFTLISFVLLFIAVVNSQTSYTLTTTTYSSSTTSGSLITYLFSNSCTISNNNTKGYGTGTNGIKYSAGTQYTITFPSAINIDSVNFTGYDNYSGKKSYFSEVNTVTGAAWNDSTQYFLTAKTVVGTTSTAVISSVTFKYPTRLTTSTFSYTPAGNQIVVAIKVFYTSGGTTGVQNVTLDADTNKPTNVYTIDGRRIKTNVFRSLATEGLKPGMYIIDNKKVVVTQNIIK